MPTLVEVRDEIADVLRTGLSGWSVSGFVGDAVTAPQIKVAAMPYDPRYVFGETKRSVSFRCTAYVSRGSDTDHGERMLDALAEPTGTSLIAKIQDGTLWSVTVDYAVVTLVGETFATKFGNDEAEYLARSFDVEVVW